MQHANMKSCAHISSSSSFSLSASLFSLSLQALSRYTPTEISVSSSENQRDVLKYISVLLTPHFVEEEVEKAVGIVFQKTGGLFLYARLLLEELLEDRDEKGEKKEKKI